VSLGFLALGVIFADICDVVRVEFACVELVELLEASGVEVVSDDVFDCIPVVVVVVTAVVLDGVGAGARFFFEPGFRDTSLSSEDVSDSELPSLA